MLRGEILAFFLIALPESDQHSTWKLVVGRWISFWDGLFSRAKWQNVSFREGMFIRILVFTNHDLVGAVCYLSPKKLNQPSIARISLDTCQSMREDPIASTRVNHDSTGACHDCILKRYLSLPQASNWVVPPEVPPEFLFLGVNFEFFNNDTEPQFRLAGSLSAIDPWSLKTPRHTWLSIANDKIHPHFGHSTMSHLWLLFARLAWTPYK